MAQKRIVTVSAPGKIIFSGEHSVVYGQPALLAALNRRLSVKVEKALKGIQIIADEPTELAQYALQKTLEILREEIDGGLKIRISSNIPVARGMGSSAALAVAMTGGLFRFLEKPWDRTLINQTAYEIEKRQHGNPSGGDNSIVCYGGFLRFQKRRERFIIKPIKIKRKLPEFVLLDSGRAKETTGEMVGLVKEKLERQNVKIKRILDLLGKVTEKFITSFKRGEFTRLADLIKENEKLLEELGVVGERTKNLIRKIEKLGGAAKICGAGGLREGSGVMLCYHQDPKAILKFAKNQGLVNFPVKLGIEGLRDEKS